jgi:catechol 2,3-dioxygenase-like lactoylglutathione lyase family enzyme
MTRDIAFCAYPSSNVAALRAWYETHLGLKFKGAYEEDGVEQYNEADVGSGCFALMNHAWVRQPPGSGGGVAFAVDDLSATLSALTAAGIESDEPHVTPVCTSTTVRDPEGNVFFLHQSTRQQ